MACKYRKDDHVMVMSGRDKGKTGKVMSVFPAQQKILVEGINEVTKAVKPTDKSQGGLIKKPAPISWSKVQLCVDDKPVRVSFKYEKDGERRSKVRIAVQTGKQI